MAKKCENCHNDPAEVNFAWPTSRGAQSANLCGVCAAQVWNAYRHTPAFSALTVSEMR